MKIRNGFVSNSSSSSFICDLCGETQSGYDCSPSDFGGFSCEFGHMSCCEINYNIGYEEKLKFIINHKYYKKEVDSINSDSLLSDDGKRGALLEISERAIFDDVLPSEFCPICSMKVISDNDLRHYLMMLTNISDAEILIEIKKENKRRRKVYNSDYISYALARLKKTKEEVVTEIKNKFKDYDSFITYAGE